MSERPEHPGEKPVTPQAIHAIWCETVGCGCLAGPHHHHHDYIETLYVQDRSGCEACLEMDARRDDDWHWPYRWVYDWHPPCRCSSTGAGVSTPEGDER